MTSETSSWFGALETTSGAWEAEPELGSFGRLWRVFMTARVAIASVLVVLQAVIYALGNITNGWSIAVSLAYLCASVAVRLWARPRPPGSTFDVQWVLTIGVDVIAFSLLNFLQSSGFNYTPLFALPVLLSSVLGPILLAFGTASRVYRCGRNACQIQSDSSRNFACGRGTRDDEIACLECYCLSNTINQKV